MVTEDGKSLSVVVISHNQRETLKRCIESILQQKTDFPVEVIVSDDRSNDGTKEMLLNEYDGMVKATFFDSDEYTTYFTLQRAALNRINGLKLATGKYLIHIDGDDFFTSSDIFQILVDALDAHVECTMSCQNFKVLPSDNLEKAVMPFSKSNHFQKESILSASQFMKEIGLLTNSCFCVRREGVVDINTLTSTTYDDGDITLRYLGNGSVAIVNRVNFMYVQYPNSTCATMFESDKSIIFYGGITGLQLAPHLSGVLLRKNLIGLMEISKQAIKRSHFSDNLILYCRKFDVFVLNSLDNHISLTKWIRYVKIFCLSFFLHYFKVQSNNLLRRLYLLAVKDTIDSDVIF